MHDYEITQERKDGGKVFRCRACGAVVPSSTGRVPAVQSCPKRDGSTDAVPFRLVDLICPRRVAIEVVTVPACATCTVDVEVGTCEEFGGPCTLVGGRVGRVRTRGCLYCDVPGRLSAAGKES